MKELIGLGLIGLVVIGVLMTPGPEGAEWLADTPHVEVETFTRGKQEKPLAMIACVPVLGIGGLFAALMLFKSGPDAEKAIPGATGCSAGCATLAAGIILLVFLALASMATLGSPL